MAAGLPHIDFRREVTIGHLLLDTNSRAGVLAKVNPPIRPRRMSSSSGSSCLKAQVDWVVSDHACCRHETKAARHALGNIWLGSASAARNTCCPALVSERASAA